MKQKHILFIAPESFPVNGAEAIVNIKLLKLLSRVGYKIDLISKQHNWKNYPSENTLSELDIQLNSHAIVTVDNKFNLPTLLLHIFTFFKFGVVFKGAHWAHQAVSVYEKNLKNENYDYVLTKSSPSLLVGYYLKSKYKLRWIASWNDPYPMEKYPAPYGKGIHAKLPWYSANILKIMNKADYHIFPSKRLRKYILQYLNINSNVTTIIPHIAYRGDKSEIKTHSILKLIHSGNLKYPRDPKPFLEGLAKFIMANKSANLQVDFIGVFDPNLKKLISTLNLGNYVRLKPPMSYKESLNILEKYNIAIIIEADCDEGIFLPTKVGDYMQMGKPIFAVSPEKGVLNDLYSENYVQYFAIQSNVESIFNEINKIYKNYSEANLNESKFNNDYSEEAIALSYQKL